jgi:hypothetical protein
MMKSRIMEWAEHVTRMSKKTNMYAILVGNPEGKRPLGRSRRRWKDNIKIDLKAIGWEGGRVWSGFIRFRTEVSSVSLRTS